VNTTTVANPVSTPQRDRALFGPIFGLLHKILSAVWKNSLGRVACRRERRLQLCETVSLGERRLVALIQLDNQPLLVGVTGSSITLLAQPVSCPSPTPPASDFREALRASGVPE
jgi:flagellar biogenesis protein FliO